LQRGLRPTPSNFYFLNLVLYFSIKNNAQVFNKKSHTINLKISYASNILGEIRGAYTENLPNYYNLIFTNQGIVCYFIGVRDLLRGWRIINYTKKTEEMLRKAQETEVTGTYEEMLMRHEKNFFIDYNNIKYVELWKISSQFMIRITLLEKIPGVVFRTLGFVRCNILPITSEEEIKMETMVYSIFIEKIPSKIILRKGILALRKTTPWNE